MRWRRPVAKLGSFLDIEGDRGQIILPPGPGRFWDPHLPFDLELPPMPAWMHLPMPQVERRGAITPVGELDGYCEAALRSAWASIMGPPPGERHVTLLREVFAIAGLADDYGMPASVALRTLEQAGLKQPRRKPRPSTKEVLKTVKDAFGAGLRSPRRKLR